VRYLSIMAASGMLARAVEAYGGEALWRNAGAVEVVYSAWGWAFRLKWRRPFRRAWARLEVPVPRARIRPIDRAGTAAVLEGQDVRLEDASGKVVASRPQARRFFPGGRRLLYWDRLDQAYFAGYALWNYMVLPALLLRDDIEWREIGEGTLEARFPPHLPTHCERQRFRFDPRTGLLLQHDYTAEVFGSWAKAAHVVTGHGAWEGIPFPASRRVTPRRGNGSPRAWPLLVGIELHEWRLLKVP
jgi:hypothetical protein